MTPPQKANGTKGARVVAVPLKTGRKISPAAFLAAILMGTFPLSKIRWVFSMTTIASSTTIPRPNKKLNNTIMFMVKSIPGRIKNAMNMERGTESPTKMALVTPMKNIKMMVTKMNPMMMVLIKSCSVTRVVRLWSPVITTDKSFGNLLSFISATISLILSEASIKFSPPRLMTFKVITFFLSNLP